MLIDEEELDCTQEILHMLSDILKTLDDEQFFSLALTFLKKSLEESLLKSELCQCAENFSNSTLYS